MLFILYKSGVFKFNYLLSFLPTKKILMTFSALLKIWRWQRVNPKYITVSQNKKKTCYKIE